MNPFEQGSYEKSLGTGKNGKARTSGNVAIRVEGSNWFQVNKKARRQDFRPYLSTQHSSRFHTPLLNTQMNCATKCMDAPVFTVMAKYQNWVFAKP